MKKFEDKYLTAKNEKRASVELTGLETIWFNTGTLCNLECKNCYIESSPKNDALVYLTTADVDSFMNEIVENEYPTKLVGITGGEPFLNPDILEILDSVMARGYDVLVLTNAYRVLDRYKDKLKELNNKYPKLMHLRVSLDHYTEKVHEEQRGLKTFDRTLKTIKWLYDNDFNISIAGRSLLNESVGDAISGFQNLLNDYEVNLKLVNNDNLVIFPEMIHDENVPEITVDCWGILDKLPEDQMCATERMIVKRKGDKEPVVLPCTLLAYDKQFELGTTLKNSDKSVYLNDPYCSKFCVLGGASCSSAK